MQVRQIMAGHPITVTPHTTIAEAAGKLRDHNIGCLIVSDNGGAAGIITDRDIAIQCTSEGHDPKQCKVTDYMSTPVVTIEPSADVLEAARTMNERQVKRLVVTEGERLVGLVSMSDVAQAMAEPIGGILMGMGATRRVTSSGRGF